MTTGDNSHIRSGTYLFMVINVKPNSPCRLAGQMHLPNSLPTMKVLANLFPTLLLRKKLLYTGLLFMLLLSGLYIHTKAPLFKNEARMSANSALPYTAAIVYLVRLADVSELLDSLASVNRDVPGHPWPVILFHTGDFDEETPRMEFLSHLHDHIGAENGSRALSDRIEFVKLDWQLPIGISSDVKIVDPVEADRWPGMRVQIAVLFQIPGC
jgi:hypothetical protein